LGGKEVGGLPVIILVLKEKTETERVQPALPVG
jgi:hypothetical protein